MPASRIPVLTLMTAPISTYLKEYFPEETLEHCEDVAFYIAYNILQARHVEGEMFVVTPVKF
jgi:hypothetical protein